MKQMPFLEATPSPARSRLREFLSRVDLQWCAAARGHAGGGRARSRTCLDAEGCERGPGRVPRGFLPPGRRRRRRTTAPWALVWTGTSVGSLQLPAGLPRNVSLASCHMRVCSVRTWAPGDPSRASGRQRGPSVWPAWRAHSACLAWCRCAGETDGQNSASREPPFPSTPCVAVSVTLTDFPSVCGCLRAAGCRGLEGQGPFCVALSPGQNAVPGARCLPLRGGRTRTCPW